MGILYQIDMEGVPVMGWDLRDRPLVVGRGEFAEARVDDDSLSRTHFMILREASAFYVVDLESQNGTFLNGEPVSGRKLEHGGIIRAGKSLFFFAAQRVETEAPSLMLPTANRAVSNALVGAG